MHKLSCHLSTYILTLIFIGLAGQSCKQFACTWVLPPRARSQTERSAILDPSSRICLPVCLLCCSLHHHQSRPERLTSASSPPQLWGWPFPNLTPVWLAGRGKARIRGATLGEDLPWGSGPQKPQRIPTWQIRVRSYYLREGGRFHTDFNTLKSFNFLIMSLVVWYVPKSDDWTWTGNQRSRMLSFNTSAKQRSFFKGQTTRTFTLLWDWLTN